MSAPNPDQTRDTRQFAIELLRANWQESGVPGRVQPVPRPEFVEAATNDGTRARNFARKDVIQVSDGGDPIVEPASIGFRDKRVEQVIDVRIRTSHSKARFLGRSVDETYGGLVGEVERIVDSLRFGAGSYEYIFYDTFREESENFGADVWTGTWPIRFIAYNAPIFETGDT